MSSVFHTLPRRVREFSEMNIYSTLKYYLMFVKVFGLFPFDLKQKGSNYVLSLSPFWTIWMIFIFGIQIFVTIFPFFLTLDFNLIVIYQLWKVLAVLGIILNIIQTLYQIMKSKKISQLLCQFEILDDKLNQIEIQINSNRDKRKIASFIAIPIICVKSYCVFAQVMNYFEGSFTKQLDVNLYISLTISEIITFFYASQFCIFAWLLKKRFEKLEEYLENALIIDKFVSKNDKIKVFSELFSLCCRIIENINEVFASNMMLTFLYVLMHEIFASYGAVKSLIEGRIFKSISHVCWFLILGFLSYFTCSFGDAVRSSAESSQKILITQSMMSSDEKFKSDLLKLHYFLDNHDKNVGNVFFAINFKLIMIVSLLNSFKRAKNHCFLPPIVDINSCDVHSYHNTI